MTRAKFTSLRLAALVCAVFTGCLCCAQGPADTMMRTPFEVKFSVAEQDLRSDAIRLAELKEVRSAVAIRGGSGVGTQKDGPNLEPRIRRYTASYATDGKRFVYSEELADAKPDPFVGEHPSRVVALFDGKLGYQFSFDGAQLRLTGTMPAGVMDRFPLPGIGMWPAPLKSPLPVTKAELEGFVLSYDQYRKRLPSGALPANVAVRLGGSDGMPIQYQPGFITFQRIEGQSVPKEVSAFCPGFLLQSWTFDHYRYFGGRLIASKIDWAWYGDRETSNRDASISRLRSGLSMPPQPHDWERHFSVDSVSGNPIDEKRFDYLSYIAAKSVVSDHRDPKAMYAYTYDSGKTFDEMRATSLRQETFAKNFKPKTDSEIQHFALYLPIVGGVALAATAALAGWFRRKRTT